MTRDETFMNIALLLAQEAAQEGEVPVGAVIVKGEEVIATGRNRREIGKNALYHAELEAIHNACAALRGWRLWQCELFVTLEPCPMCTGAIINARIPRVVYGARDTKAGSCGSVVNLFDFPYNHKPQVVPDVLGPACTAVLQDFFKDLRVKKKAGGK